MTTGYYRTCPPIQFQKGGILTGGVTVSMNPFSCFRFLHHNIFKSHRPLQRIFSLARKAACDEFDVEFVPVRIEDMPEGCDMSIQSVISEWKSALRLTFFKCSASDAKAERKLMGYVLFFQGTGGPGDFPGQIYESVMSPAWVNESGPYLHRTREYRVATWAGDYSVNGVLYAQQNRVDTSCSHAAIRTALSCVLHDADIDYSVINDHLRKIRCAEPHDYSSLQGMGGEEIADIINNLGGGTVCKQLTFVPKHRDDFYDQLYEWVEAGVPAILCFECANQNTGDSNQHAVTVIGHAFDDHHWRPAARQMYFPFGRGGSRYASSEGWVNSYILHDGNCGPYLTMPKNFLDHGNANPVIFGLSHFTPTLTSATVELLAERLLHKILKYMPVQDSERTPMLWDAILRRQHELKRLVFRPIYTTKETYKAHLEKVSSQDGNQVLDTIANRILFDLPKHFWLVEVSCHEMFGVSRRKFGDVLIRDDNIYGDSDNVFISARLPYYVCYDTKGVNYKRTYLDGHTELF